MVTFSEEKVEGFGEDLNQFPRDYPLSFETTVYSGSPQDCTLWIANEYRNVTYELHGMNVVFAIEWVRD